MKIAKRQVKDVSILELSGKLIIGEGDVLLRGELLDELDQGFKKIVLDLKEVKTMDSSGLGELIRCRATATSKQADVKLLNVNLKTYKLLTMSRLIGVFDMFDDESKAIASFD